MKDMIAFLFTIILALFCIRLGANLAHKNAKGEYKFMGIVIKYDYSKEDEDFLTINIK